MKQLWFFITILLTSFFIGLRPDGWHRGVVRSSLEFSHSSNRDRRIASISESWWSRKGEVILVGAIAGSESGSWNVEMRFKEKNGSVSGKSIVTNDNGEEQSVYQIKGNRKDHKWYLEELQLISSKGRQTNNVFSPKVFVMLEQAGTRFLGEWYEAEAYKSLEKEGQTTFLKSGDLELRLR